MKISRREFVQSTVASGAVCSGLIVVGCGNDVQPAPVLPEPLPVNPDGTVTVNVKVMTANGLVDHYPDLAPIGGAITIPLMPATGAPSAILLIHRADPATLKPGELAYVAVNSTCPHAGCPLGYSAKDQLIECPCHSSQFLAGPLPQSVGQVVHLPAVEGPPSFLITPNADFSVLSIQVVCSASVSFANHPELTQPGGGAVIGPPEISCPVVVIRKDAGTVVALDARCTHQQCIVGLKFNPPPDGMPMATPTVAEIDCPCHGSRFDLNGNVLQGPAPAPLAQLPARLTADGVDVNK